MMQHVVESADITNDNASTSGTPSTRDMYHVLHRTTNRYEWIIAFHPGHIHSVAYCVHSGPCKTAIRFMPFYG